MFSIHSSNKSPLIRGKDGAKSSHVRNFALTFAGLLIVGFAIGQLSRNGHGGEIRAEEQLGPGVSIHCALIPGMAQQPNTNYDPVIRDDAYRELRQPQNQALNVINGITFDYPDWCTTVAFANIDTATKGVTDPDLHATICNALKPPPSSAESSTVAFTLSMGNPLLANTIQQGCAPPNFWVSVTAPWKGSCLPELLNPENLQDATATALLIKAVKVVAGGLVNRLVWGAATQSLLPANLNPLNLNPTVQEHVTVAVCASIHGRITRPLMGKVTDFLQKHGKPVGPGQECMNNEEGDLCVPLESCMWPWQSLAPKGGNVILTDKDHVKAMELIKGYQVLDRLVAAGLPVQTTIPPCEQRMKDTGGHCRMFFHCDAERDAICQDGSCICGDGKFVVDGKCVDCIMPK